MPDRIYKILGRKGRITIPLEVRAQLGFTYNDIISFTVTESGVLLKREKICDNCKHQEQWKEIKDQPSTMLDYLDRLSPAEQRAALIHLSVKWAEKEGKV